MADANELDALKASFRGVLDSADALLKLRERIEAFGVHAPPDDRTLEDLARVSAAHAVASAALRGFLVRMLERRHPVGD